MNYKKIKKNSYTLHFINTTRFKMIEFKVIFTKEFDKNNIKYYSLLDGILSYSTKKYNTRKKLINACEDLYGSNLNANYSVYNNLEKLSFELSFLNPKYTDKSLYKKNFDLFFEFMFNPNAIDNRFDTEAFNIVKKDYINMIDSKKDNINLYAHKKFRKIMFKGLSKSYDELVTKKELNEINEKNLYEFYSLLFDGGYKIDVFFHGDINECDIECFDNKISTIKSNINALNPAEKYKPIEKLVIKKESLSFNQSKLLMGYNFIDLTKYEKDYVLNVYNNILGSMNNSILFSTVREKHSLCYYIHSFSYKDSSSIVVDAGINKKGYKETKVLIEKCTNMMKDKKVISDLLTQAKMQISTKLNIFYDNSDMQLEYYYIKEFEEIPDIEKLREKYSSVTLEDVLNISKKIKLSVVYFFEGDKSD